MDRARNIPQVRPRFGERLSRAFPYALNAPSLVVMLVLIIYPVLASLWVSLTNYTVQTSQDVQFVGLRNYRRLMADPGFWHSLGVTFHFTALAVVATVVLGMAIALLLNLNFPGRGLVRALALVPWAIPPVVNGMMWRWILNSKFGVLNGLLTALHLISHNVTWLVNPDTVLYFVVLAHVWNQVPFASIVFLAGLQSIPAEMYEAADVDGAGPVKQFWYLTLPWLLQPLLIVLIFQTMVALRVFDVFYVLTDGGPGNATNVLALLTYKTAFTYFDFGLGNAYAYVLALLTLVISVVYIKVLYRRGDIGQ